MWSMKRGRIRCRDVASNNIKKFTADCLGEWSRFAKKDFSCLPTQTEVNEANCDEDSRGNRIINLNLL